MARKPYCQTKRDVIPIILNHILCALGITVVVEEMGNQSHVGMFIAPKEHNKIMTISNIEM